MKKTLGQADSERVRHLSEDEVSILLVVLVIVRVRISVVPHFILLELVQQEKEYI